VSATGPKRAAELASQVLASPLFEEGRAIEESDTLLVSIVGGPDLTLAGINEFMEQINRRAEKARLIVGATAVEGYEDKLQVTLIASRKPAHDMNPEAGAGRAHGYSDHPSHLDDARVSRAFLGGGGDGARPSRFVAPPPELTPETREKLLVQQPSARGRKAGGRWRQGQLPLEVISKGRFEKSQPTVHNGEDLDVPTYIRRGIALN
jgi:cell division protein FtsZ